MSEAYSPKGAPSFSRREFNRTLLSAGVATAGVMGGLMPSPSALAAEPRRGGRLRVAMASQSAHDTLDPAKFVAAADYVRGFMVYNGLTRIDRRMQPQPELAESFEANADATEWTFKLRRDVTFHDGKALEAEDVVYSIMRHKDEQVASGVKSLVEDIAEVTADGKDRVVIKLHSANADIPNLLGTYQFMIIKEGTTDFTTAVGTGPFKVKEFRPGIRIVGARNENYFKEGRPYVEELEVFSIADPVARLNALMAGDIQMMQDLRPSTIPDVENTAGLAVFSTPCPRFLQFAMLCDRPPTESLDLRLAIKNLLDRERLVNFVLKGHGVIANDHLVMPESELYNSSLPQRTLDLDKAKFHLKKAGMENATLEVHVSDASANGPEMGLLLQNDAAKVGLKIDLQRDPADGYWSNVWMKRPIVALAWFPKPTYNIMLSAIWKSDAKFNDTHYRSPRLDQLIDEARGALETTRRKDLFWEIQKIIYDDGGNAIPAFVNYVDAVSASVKGLEAVPTGSLGGFNFADSVWLES